MSIQPTQKNAAPAFRDPNLVFEAAIKQGVLSTDSEVDNYAGDFMYMGDNSEGKAMFKSIPYRTYLPAVRVEV
jgi:hypothetical protein